MARNPLALWEKLPPIDYTTPDRTFLRCSNCLKSVLDEERWSFFTTCDHCKNLIYCSTSCKMEQQASHEPFCKVIGENEQKRKDLLSAYRLTAYDCRCYRDSVTECNKKAYYRRALRDNQIRSYMVLINCGRKNNSLVSMIKGLKIFAGMVFENMTFEDITFFEVKNLWDTCDHTYNNADSLEDMLKKMTEHDTLRDIHKWSSNLNLQVPTSGHHLDLDTRSPRSLMTIRSLYFNLEIGNFEYVYRQIKCLSNGKRPERACCTERESMSARNEEMFEDLEELHELDNLSLYLLTLLMVLKIRLYLFLKCKMDPWYSFLLGGHPRLGEDSNVLKISRCLPVLELIFQYTVRGSVCMSKIKGQCSRLMEMVKQRNKFIVPRLLAWNESGEEMDLWTEHALYRGKASLDMPTLLHGGTHDRELDARNLIFFAVQALGKTGLEIFFKNETVDTGNGYESDEKE